MEWYFEGHPMKLQREEHYIRVELEPEDKLTVEAIRKERFEQLANEPIPVPKKPAVEPRVAARRTPG
jgi:hypothetical protein